MRGFLFGAVMLIGLDVVLTSQAPRVAGAIAPVTGWLVNWLDPTVPLISDHAGATSSSSSSSSHGKPSAGAVRQKAGKCPPGYVPDNRNPGYCKRA